MADARTAEVAAVAAAMDTAMAPADAQPVAVVAAVIVARRSSWSRAEVDPAADAPTVAEDTPATTDARHALRAAKIILSTLNFGFATVPTLVNKSPSIQKEKDACARWSPA